MIVAMLIFFTSLVCIIVLFAFKYWEYHTDRRIAAGLRLRADEKALQLKEALVRGRGHLEKLPPEIVYISRRGVHILALGAASIARGFEREAHRLADLVSHKRGFERRETKSDFLKNVTEYKNDSELESKE